MTWLRAQWDRVAGFGLIGLGGLALLLGFRGVTNSVYVADQLSYIISGGLGGLYLLGSGAVLLVVAELRDEWRKLDTIEALLREGRPEVSAPPEDRAGRGPSPEPGATGVERTPAKTRSRRRVASFDDALPPQFAPVTLVALGGALVALSIAFLATHGEVDPDSALRSTSWAIAALVAAGTVVGGSTLWAERRVKLRQSRVFAPITLRRALALSEAAPVARLDGVSRVVVAKGLTRYHRPGCAAVAGLTVKELDVGDAPDGLSACGLCL